MISPSYISRILTDSSLTESQKSDTIFGLVQDAFIDGYSIGTERLISTIKERESVIQDHTPFDPQPGDIVVANYDVRLSEKINFYQNFKYIICSVDPYGITVFTNLPMIPYTFERTDFFKHFSKKY